MRLGDGATDKFEFRTDCTPAPNGVTTRFFAGQTRITPNSLQVFLDGVTPVSGAPSYTVDEAEGSFELALAPTASQSVQASYYYQWFTDADLASFLTDAVQLLSFEVVTDEALPIGLRPVVTDFAAHYAYMRKATEYADSIVASDGGVQADQSRSHPNWKGLADGALAAAQQKLAIYQSNPLARKQVPGFALIAFKLQSWVPRS